MYYLRERTRARIAKAKARARARLGLGPLRLGLEVRLGLGHGGKARARVGLLRHGRRGARGHMEIGRHTLGVTCRHTLEAGQDVHSDLWGGR